MNSYDFDPDLSSCTTSLDITVNYYSVIECQITDLVWNINSDANRKQLTKSKIYVEFNCF